MELCIGRNIRENTAISSTNIERTAKNVLRLVSLKTYELDKPLEDTNG